MEKGGGGEERERETESLLGTIYLIWHNGGPLTV
jgi:hypothetical protein